MMNINEIRAMFTGKCPCNGSASSGCGLDTSEILKRLGITGHGEEVNQ